MISVNKLVKAKEKYDLEILNIENQIRNKVDFVFSILYQESDGFVVLSEETSENARLTICLRVINEKGKLSYEDYKKLTI